MWMWRAWREGVCVWREVCLTCSKPAKSHAMLSKITAKSHAMLSKITAKSHVMLSKITCKTASHMQGSQVTCKTAKSCPHSSNYVRCASTLAAFKRTTSLTMVTDACLRRLFSSTKFLHFKRSSSSSDFRTAFSCRTVARRALSMS